MPKVYLCQIPLFKSKQVNQAPHGEEIPQASKVLYLARSHQIKRSWFDPMATQSAVIDRIVDGTHAVLLVGPDEVERIVPRRTLPADVREGTWLKVRFRGDCLVDAVIDTEATEAAAQRITAKMDLLRQRGRPQN